MRAFVPASVLATLVLSSAASAAITVPSIGSPTKSYISSAPTGNSYVRLDAVAGGGSADDQSKSVTWMPSKRRFEVTPDASGHVDLTLGMTLRWENELPHNNWSLPPQAVRRYFKLCGTTDTAAYPASGAFTYGGNNEAYISSGWEGTLASTPANAWTRVELQYSFTVPMDDAGTPIRWFISEERTLEVAQFNTGGTISPFSVSIDDVTTVSNGVNSLSDGGMEFDASQLAGKWGFWDGRTSSTQTLVAVPEPTSLALLALPALAACVRRRRA